MIGSMINAISNCIGTHNVSELTVPGTMQLDGRAHGKDKEKAVLLAVLLREGFVDAKHICRQRLDIKFAFGSSYQLAETTTSNADSSDSSLAGVGSINRIVSHLVTINFVIFEHNLADFWCQSFDE